ncbi:unnamed protein product [Cyclocybe aegerita]|uniref:Uncharacterized protein n=1 Tax=Cyclocybe aegerita TaxID=1973307 RepID=A0A8S0VSY0_CYCAE|nr:unnamed protein product [Cyclocybe aegerita]
MLERARQNLEGGTYQSPKVAPLYALTGALLRQDDAVGPMRDSILFVGTARPEDERVEHQSTSCHNTPQRTRREATGNYLNVARRQRGLLGAQWVSRASRERKGGTRAATRSWPDH